MTEKPEWPMDERHKQRRHLAAVADSVLVCLDSAEENMVLAMALNADRVLDSTWNGWARPVATAAAFGDFIARWRLNDRHGTWGAVTELEGALRYEDSEGDEPEEFPSVGANPYGEALYDLTGWMWVQIR